MCGIVGAYAFTEKGREAFGRMPAAVATLRQRGPDGHGTEARGSAALGHARLAILDVSDAAAQPFADPSGRFTIVFNGEIFNFKELRDVLPGARWQTSSDTEVLLQLFMHERERMLPRLNGFFAFAIHDREEDTLFLARDRMGIKPLLLASGADGLAFGSEMKALMELGVPRQIDEVSQFLYHQFSYTPFPHTIFTGVREMGPGTWMTVGPKGAGEEQTWWQLPKPGRARFDGAYEAAKAELVRLMRQSVRRRMVSDVPLGSFLSGGIDSSVIATLAAEQTGHLRTFSIGYADEPHFDETHYAELVAQRIGSRHTVFKLTNDDLLSELPHVLDYLDRPFSDSSCLPVHILCRRTKEHVTVALSGDGADELFSGYNKHRAEFRARSGGAVNALVALAGPLWHLLPASRQGRVSNLIRQVRKFSDGLRMSPAERYWAWASFMPPKEVAALMGRDLSTADAYIQRKKHLLSEIKGVHGMDEMLHADLHQVLRNDMLTKVDLMSMANGLEVRVPFLDHEVVEFACSLPEEYKITATMRKRIVQDAFRDLLPPELYNRPKHGFEVPLLGWFRTSLREMILNDLLSKELIAEQGIFDFAAIRSLLTRMGSPDPGDTAYQVWNLIVFQHWWKRHMRAMA